MNTPSMRNQYSMRIEWEPLGGVYVATVPELPGCLTHGRSHLDALHQGRDAIESWIDAKRSWRRPIPGPRVGPRWVPPFLRSDELTFLRSGEPIELDRYSLDIVWQPDDSVFLVIVRELLACQATGETDDEAVIRGLDAVERWIQTRNLQPIPRPKHYDLEMAKVPA